MYNFYQNTHVSGLLNKKDKELFGDPVNKTLVNETEMMVSVLD